MITLNLFDIKLKTYLSLISTNTSFSVSNQLKQLNDYLGVAEMRTR